MQPMDDAKSIAATTKLLSTGICDFDLKMTGPWLQAFLCSMCMCTDTKSHYHSFVGKVAEFCWSVSKFKVHLWGTCVYALCGMKKLYKVLEYDGPIHSLCRWSQELMAYQFLTFH